MTKRRLAVAALLAGGLAVASGGCGDDDEAGETPALGTCDLRSVSHHCIELHEPSASDFENQKEGCAERDGKWSSDVCPTEALVGCCDYEFGNVFRECFYTGVTTDAEMYCSETVHGVWTPAL
jgi:hypothetical protein